MEVVHNNLIDSNKFIRSVFLTMDHFMEGGRVGRFQQAATFFSTSKFFSLFLELNRRVCYLALLVSTISIDTLTMENVSCLNTVLIILILSTRQGTLTNYLKMLATRTVDQLDLGNYKKFKIYFTHFHDWIIYGIVDCAAEPTGTEYRAGGSKKQRKNLEPRHIFSSLFQLSRFWRVYLPCDESWTYLEKDSGIALGEWIHTVDLLTSVDTTSPYSLLHYLPEDQLRIVQTFMETEMEGS